MACFSLGFVENLLIWLVIVCLIVAIFRLLIPKLLGLLGSPPGAGTVITILGWIIGAIVLIFIIILVFDLLSCVIGGGGLHLGYH